SPTRRTAELPHCTKTRIRDLGRGRLRANHGARFVHLLRRKRKNRGEPMLDPWIIEEIRREEEARQRREDRSQPVIEMPRYDMPSVGGEAKPSPDNDV